MGASGGDAGETLLESLISMLVVSIGLVGLLSSLAAGTALSSAHQAQSRADVLLHTVVEAWDEPASYAAGDLAQGALAATLAAVPSVAGLTPVAGTVRCWTGTSLDITSTTAFAPCTTENDRGLQLVHLEVREASGKALQSMDVLKRCVASTCPARAFS